MAPIVTVDASRIVDWTTFHRVFAEAFGFPDFYGCNMDAWIDCMTCLDDPGAGLSRVHAERGRFVTLRLENVAAFVARCPDQYNALVESAAFVNYRRIERGAPAVIALAFDA